MLYPNFKKRISQIVQSELGGFESQLKLAPPYRRDYSIEDSKTNNTNIASVLILFFPNPLDQQTCFVLTKRADYDGHHAKQISFPGGKKEDTDSDLIATALRETKEEIGVEIGANNIFKKMSNLFIPPSNFIVEPYLAYIDSYPHFQKNYEVAEIITPTLNELLDIDTIKNTQVRTFNGTLVETPYFSLQNEVVWGATAMMLSELRDLLKRSL